MTKPTKDFKFSAAELESAHMFIAKSLAFYDDKDERGIQIDSPLRQLVHEEVLNSVVVRDGSGKRFIPDGIGYITCENFPRYDRAAIFFTELRNGIGAGGSDLISQLQYDYTAFYSSGLRKPLRDACCCPAILIGIAGPYVIIAGAVFADRFISQNLTDYLYVGGSPFIGPRVYEIAKVFQVLKECIADLDGYYSELSPWMSPVSRNLSQHRQSMMQSFSNLHPSSEVSTLALFPHFKKFSHATTGHGVELEYIERLQPEWPEKAIFTAFAQCSDSHETSTVVVKFTLTYCQKAHDLLQKNLLAPRLWLCDTRRLWGCILWSWTSSLDME